MKPKLAVVEYEGIHATLWFWKDLEPRKRYQFMIFCYGLPSHPYQHNPAKVERLLEEGFVMIYPDYRGTWGSGGRMSWEGCVETILATIDFLNKGKAVEAYGLQSIRWAVKDITLVGGSFGGAVALVAGAKSQKIKNIISVAAPTDWRTHSRIPGENSEPIESLFRAIERGWKYLWRIPNRTEWMRLAEGRADLNAIDYIQQLRRKNILLIHGARDSVVRKERSLDLYKHIKNGKGKHRLIILKEEGHLGNDIVGEKKVFAAVLDFLRETEI